MQIMDLEARIAEGEGTEGQVPPDQDQTTGTFDWELEEAADDLLRRMRSGTGGPEALDGPGRGAGVPPTSEFRTLHSALRIYSERGLARKMRLEGARLPQVEETALPEVAIDYLLKRQIKLLADSARLTKFQAAVLALTLEGWGLTEMSMRFGLSYQIVRRSLTIAQTRIEIGGSPYDGLYEVYWGEVHRYVYRRRGR